MSFPGDAPAVWQGVFGGAIVVKGAQIIATTSDGAVHFIK